MLTAAGNVNQPYAVLGVIHAVVTKPAKDAGCSGGGGCRSRRRSMQLLKALEASAAKSGGDGLIHVSSDYRVSTTSMACNQSKEVFEVYGWGTVTCRSRPGIERSERTCRAPPTAVDPRRTGRWPVRYELAFRRIASRRT